MLTTLWTSKSGLNANQEKLDVISNNIANVNTTGYKKVNAGFKDLISSSLDEWGNPLNDKTASDFAETAKKMKVEDKQVTTQTGTFYKLVNGMGWR